MFFGIYMITVADPQILWNDGFYPLIDVTIPDDSFWKPRYPAALNARLSEGSAMRHKRSIPVSSSKNIAYNKSV